MKLRISKMFSLINNYKSSLKYVIDKLPPFSDPYETSPERYFLTSEVIEEICKMEIQFCNKFEVIVEMSLQEVKSRKFSTKEESRFLANAIEEFKSVTRISMEYRERALIHLSGVEDPNFTSKMGRFSSNQRNAVEFANGTLRNYDKKSKQLSKLYNTSFSKVSKLYRTSTKYT